MPFLSVFQRALKRRSGTTAGGAGPRSSKTKLQATFCEHGKVETPRQKTVGYNAHRVEDSIGNSDSDFTGVFTLMMLWMRPIRCSEMGKMANSCF